MSWFARIEQACAAFVERAFAKTFPSDLEPAQVARKLVATMQADTHGADGAQTAPGRYAVRVNADDFERLAPHRVYLEQQWCALLDDIARRVGLRLDGEIGVTMEPRPGLPVGSVEIESVPRDAPRRYRLRMVRGVPAYGVYPVEGRVRIGRSEESEVFLIDPSVSRQHAAIDFDGGTPTLHDLGSRNGTFVNGERVQARRLQSGDVVTFGNTELRLEAVS